MIRISLFGTVTVVMMMTSVAAQEVSLVVEETSQDVTSSVIRHFNQRSELLGGLTIDVIDSGQVPDLISTPGAVVYIHTANVPDTDQVNGILDQLGQRADRATVMLFFEAAADFSWVTHVNKPDNVKMTVAVRAFDTAEVIETYESLGVDYLGAGVHYDYGAIAEAALAQIEPQRQNISPYTLKSWSPDLSALTVFDPVGVTSGASEGARAIFLEKARANNNLMSTDAPEVGEVVVWPVFDGTTVNDMVAIARAVADGECAGDWKWDGRIEAGMSYQSFGE